MSLTDDDTTIEQMSDWREARESLRLLLKETPVEPVIAEVERLLTFSDNEMMAGIEKLQGNLTDILAKSPWAHEWEIENLTSSLRDRFACMAGKSPAGHRMELEHLETFLVTNLGSCAKAIRARRAIGKLLKVEDLVMTFSAR